MAWLRTAVDLTGALMVMIGLESEFEEWRRFLLNDPAVDESDVEELEDHLRSQVADLRELGLAEDEAFLVAVKRMGARDELSREFAREHGGRLWRQLSASSSSATATGSAWPTMLAFAIAAAIVVLIALVVGGYPQAEPDWLARNVGLLVLPFLAGFFAVRRGVSSVKNLRWAIAFLVAGVLINVYPYESGSVTEVLVALHLPVLLWFVCSYPYTGGELRSREKRMDFVRFTGEWFIYYVLLALGGGTLMGITALILEPAGVDAERVIEWVIPAGAAGAVIVAAWLVESKQSVVENMAPVLTMIFTPLFALLLISAAVVYTVNGLASTFDRELVGVFDVLLVVVLGLVLYGISAREASPRPNLMDRVQLVTVVLAVVLDGLVLGSMVARIGELGFTPNRAAVLGLNLLLLVSLGGTGWFLARFIARKEPFNAVERWQTTYLPAFAAWTAVVVTLFPLVFSFA